MSAPTEQDRAAGRPERLVLADDHAPTRMQVADALRRSGWDVLAAGTNADQAVELVRHHRPDVALLDVHMPGHGVRAAQQISDLGGGTAVVMLTASEDDEDLFGALRAGASGYLLKSTPPDRLAVSLREVLLGEAALSPRLVTRMLQEFRVPSRRRFLRRTPAADKLTTREWEVMELLGQGHSTEETAARLFVSTTTVRVHVSAVRRKLAAPDRESALRVLRGEES